MIKTNNVDREGCSVLKEDDLNNGHEVPPIQASFYQVNHKT